MANCGQTIALGCNPTLPTCATIGTAPFGGVVTASNECGPITVTCEAGQITGNACNKQQIFTFTATACGQTTTCTRTFTWTVSTAPVMANCGQIVPLGQNPQILPTCATIQNFGGIVTASNECGPVEVTCQPGNIIENGCSLSQVFTFTATACGQTTTCTRTFTWTNCASLGDFVWHDTNANGVQDPGESGVPGVTVTLYQCSNGNVVGVPITTGPNGEYLFSGLTPGSYYVGFSNLPAGFFFSPNDMGGNDTTDSDAMPGTGLTGCEVLDPGENNLTYDAGIYQQASIGNFVWYDTNNNGIQDPLEVGVQGVTVTLYQCSNNSVVGVPVTTGANGQYLFSGLTPGNYYVGFSNLPAGFFFSPNDMGGNDTTDSDANTVTGLTGCETLTSGENNLTYDAGLNQTTETCYESCTGNNNVGAILYTTNGNGTVTIRIKFAKTFVDNTYGTSAIGWPGGHTFGNLTGSDKLTLALYDINNVQKLWFKIDYITATATVPSGYATLGVSGGEGGMLVGSAAFLSNFKTSISENFNAFGYPPFITNSPPTDANYTPNPTYPNWIYDVWYEVTVSLAAFPAGFKEARITEIHASPSKTGNNTECVQPCLPLEVVAAGSNGPCNTTCQGSITATASHGSEPYTYSWSDGPATGATRTGLCIGSYTVTVRDANGVTATATVNIAAAPTTCPSGICYQSCTNNPKVGATQTVVDNGNGTTTIRTTFAKTFVDNTYGTNAIGWPSGHTFSNLTGSDKLQLALFDAGGTKRLEFKIDYISAATPVAGVNPSGYKTLGVTGGDGGMVLGSATNVVSALTSMDVNLNTNGPSYYLTTNSPLTNASYATNLSPYPNWIYDVWYEVTVKNSAFPGGFGYPRITEVHASPSKTGNNTECVTPCLPISVTAAGNNGPCGSVGCVGSITATAANGKTPYTYTWSDGPATGATRTGLCTGSYTVTARDADGVTAQATVVIAAAQQAPCGICYQSCTNNPKVGATQTVVDTGNGTTTIRTTFAKTFVDNTYGTNAIGWPSGHTFSNLTGSDKLQLALFDVSGTKRLEFKIDYISAATATASNPSGFKTLGVLGGDGGMILGSATNVVSALTSMDVNLNTNGPSYYLTTNSPLTNASYATNLSPYPNWIYDVWYEVTVRNSAFPGGFGYPRITEVHASPSKTGNNTECVTPCTATKAIASVVEKDSIGFDVYPVPFKDLLTVRYQFDNDAEVKIEIINLLGMIIFTQTDTDGYIGKEVELNLNLNIVKDQVYFIKLTTSRGSVTKKIISQR